MTTKLVFSICALALLSGCALEDDIKGALGEKTTGKVVVQEENNIPLPPEDLPEIFNEYNTTEVYTGQITPQRPQTGDVIPIPPDTNETQYAAGDMITGITQDLGVLEDGSISSQLNAVVHNSTKGDYSTSTGEYAMLGIRQRTGSVQALSISTKPNCSIRTILSYMGPEGVNKTDRSKRSRPYDVYTSGTEIYTSSDPYAVQIRNIGNDGVLFAYFAIDNDNTNSYFNAESCKLNVSVQDVSKK